MTATAIETVLPPSQQTALSGWGRYPSRLTIAHRPERAAALDTLVAAPGSLIARGLGRSYGDASLNSAGRTVLMERLDRFLALDTERAEVECEAGVTIEDLLRHLLPRGFFPPVTPGTKFVSLGGAVACDVHGKNHHRDGSIGRHVRELELLTAAGDHVVCSRSRNADLFAATVGGMGLTGIITRVRLGLKRVETGYVAVDYDRAPDLETALRLFDETDERYAYSVAWIDCLARGRALGRSVLMRGSEAPRAALRGAAARAPFPAPARARLAVPVVAPEFALAPWSVRAFNTAYYHLRAPMARGVIQSYEPFFYPLDGIRDWNRIYGASGFLQYQCVLPFARGREGLISLLEALSASRSASFLAVLKRFGDVEPGQLLSFARPGYTLALDLPRRAPGVLALLDRLDQIVIDHGGRVYLAKDARLSREAFAAMYPETASWLTIKRRIDPDNLFRSDLGARLGLQS